MGWTRGRRRLGGDRSEVIRAEVPVDVHEAVKAIAAEKGVVVPEVYRWLLTDRQKVESIESLLRAFQKQQSDTFSAIMATLMLQSFQAGQGVELRLLPDLQNILADGFPEAWKPESEGDRDE